jgi:type I restriction enzyme S subunit
MRETCEINYKDAVFKISTTKQKLKQKEYLQIGEIPVIDQGQDVIGGYTNDKNRVLNCKLPVVIFGDHTKNVKLIKFPFAPGADGTKVLEPKTYISPSYLYYVTEVLVFKIKDKGYARHYQYIEKENFPLVSVSEQKAIVKKIEKLFSSLDSGIADLKKAQNQLVSYRQAVLKKAFEGKLTKEWREKQVELPSVKNLLKQIEEERQKYYEQQLADWKKIVKVWEENNKIGKKPIKPRVFKEFTGIKEGFNFEVPNNWRKVFLGNLSAGVEYGSGAKSLNSGDIPVIRMGNMQGGKIDWSDLKYTVNPKEIKQYLLKKGDVLFNRTNSPEHVGKTVIYKGEKPAVFAGYLIRVNHLRRLLSGAYLNYFLNSHPAKIYGNLVKTDGVNQSNINGQKLSNYSIPFCSKQEQYQVVKEIEGRLSVCDAVEQNIKESLQKATALRQSILKKAFEGKLLTKEEIAKCKADKDYEPASVLLERIKSEKKK